MIKSQIELLYETILRRRDEATDGSYTAYLFKNGLNKMLKKVGEEASETIIAAKDGHLHALTGELADLTYHLLVVMAELGLTPGDVAAELAARAEKQNNLKRQHITDKNS